MKKTLFILFVFCQTSVFSKTNNLAFLKDTSTAKFGYYFSTSAGIISIPFHGGLGAFGYHLGFSFAYKSHIVSLAHIIGRGISGGSGKSDYYETWHSGILLGEALRRKHFFCSLSGGIAKTVVWWYDGGSYHQEGDYRGTSIPVEFKMFYHSYNGIGIGTFISKNFVFADKYSPTSVMLSLVFGVWNKPNGKHPIKDIFFPPTAKPG